MKYSKSNTSKASVRSSALTSSQIIWQLVQVIWVGSLFLTQYLFLPALQNMAFAPMLVDEVGFKLRPVLVGVAALGGFFQLLLLAQQGVSYLVKDLRGLLLLGVLLLAVAYFGILQLAEQLLYMQMTLYLAITVAGLLLLVQPFPSNKQTQTEHQSC